MQGWGRVESQGERVALLKQRFIELPLEKRVEGRRVVVLNCLE
jgi:hypothetical protein